METLTEAIPMIITTLMALAAALLIGANTIAKPKRGRHAAKPERPEEPERPDLTEHKREEAVADHEASWLSGAVDDALDSDPDTGADHENPHGLADLLNGR